MNINEKIYRNVKALAEINGIDMKDIEARIGRSVGWLSRKNSKIDAETLMKLASIFEISVDELLSGNFEEELNLKIALDNLRTAVIAAAKYFDKDSSLPSIDTYVRNVISQEFGKEKE